MIGKDAGCDSVLTNLKYVTQVHFCFHSFNHARGCLRFNSTLLSLTQCTGTYEMKGGLWLCQTAQFECAGPFSKDRSVAACAHERLHTDRTGTKSLFYACCTTVQTGPTVLLRVVLRAPCCCVPSPCFTYHRHINGGSVVTGLMGSAHRSRIHMTSARVSSGTFTGLKPAWAAMLGLLTDRIRGPAPSECSPRPNCSGCSHYQNQNPSGALLIHSRTLTATCLKSGELQEFSLEESFSGVCDPLSLSLSLSFSLSLTPCGCPAGKIPLYAGMAGPTGCPVCY